jgi:hypothetical protein
MLDKVSGRVASAVMSFGGFLGFGEDFHTLPWSVLRFEPRQDAYVVDITEAQPREAPARTPEGTDPAEDGAWEEQDPPLLRRRALGGNLELPPLPWAGGGLSTHGSGGGFFGEPASACPRRADAQRVTGPHQPGR